MVYDIRRLYQAVLLYQTVLLYQAVLLYQTVLLYQVVLLNQMVPPSLKVLQYQAVLSGPTVGDFFRFFNNVRSQVKSFHQLFSTEKLFSQQN